ncbi:LysR substrate-binding domain-containing protein [Variovorax sp. VNK109]|uniref:LysR substrate-binding domain-containing protein n=1 Tax=Variovorax sp. VNK109 TaxID=3400919 RepID=UPI003C0683E1
MRLNLRQIEVFRAIMQTGSISRAAGLLNVSQPAVSRLLSYTEQRLGLKLFERIKGRLYPTPEAKRLFVEVNLVYQGVQRVNEVAEDLIEHRMGHLRLACVPSLGQGLLPHAIARFLAKYPDVRVSLFTMRPHVLINALLTQQADLALVFLTDPHPSIEATQIYGNRLVAALPANHPLTARNVVSLEDLAAEKFIGYSHDTQIGQFMRQLFADAGLTIRPAVEVQQVDIACAMVQTGIGVALIDEITPLAPVWTRVVVRPVENAVDTPVNLLRATFEPMSRIGQAFIDVLQDMKKDWSSLRSPTF